MRGSLSVDLSNTKWGRIDAISTYSREDAPSRAQRVLRPGDTVVGTVRPGNGSYALVAEAGLTGSTGFAVLRPRMSDYISCVYLAATATDNIARLSHLADGGAYPAVRPEAVAATSFTRPPDHVLAQFETTVGPILDRAAHNDRECLKLYLARDLLLPRLLSGEVAAPHLDDISDGMSRG